MGLGAILTLVCLAALLFGLLPTGAGSGTAEQLAQRLPKNSTGAAEDLDPVPRVQQVGGVDYAYLLAYGGQSWAVRASFDERALKLEPCRFDGTAGRGDLIVAGTRQLWPFLETVSEGEAFAVTDMRGTVRSYRVKAIEHHADALRETLESTDSALTLYGYVPTLGKYTVIRCEMHA